MVINFPDLINNVVGENEEECNPDLKFVVKDLGPLLCIGWCCLNEAILVGHPSGFYSIWSSKVIFFLFFF
jgi:hypothetical protein